MLQHLHNLNFPVCISLPVLGEFTSEINSFPNREQLMRGLFDIVDTFDPIVMVPNIRVSHQTGSIDLSVSPDVELIPFHRYIESACYKPGRHGFRFDPLLMLKRVIVQLLRDLPYRNVISSLSEEDCTYLEVPKSHDGYILPAASTHHHFVKYRLKEEGMNRLMEIAGRLICQVSPSTDAILKSACSVMECSIAMVLPSLRMVYRLVHR